jgi:hypothetical protein
MNGWYSLPQQIVKICNNNESKSVYYILVKDQTHDQIAKLLIH